MKTMISNVDHGDRVTSLITQVALLKKEDAQLKANVSYLESQVEELKSEVIPISKFYDEKFNFHPYLLKDLRNINPLNFLLHQFSFSAF